VREVLDAARLVTGCQIPVVETGRRPGDPAVLIASSDLIRSQLGWVRGKPGVDEMISDAWNWMRTVGAAGPG